MTGGNKIPKGLFSAELDDIVEKLLKRAGPLPNETELRLELVRRGLAVAEALVFAPMVTLKVYGENVVLAVLAKAIGPKGTRELLEEGALRFMLWQSFPVYWTESPGKPVLKGVHPLAGMRTSSQPHCDPQASAELGLRGWAPWMSKDDAVVIGRLAADRTALVDPASGDMACKQVLRAYEHGRLAAGGLDGTIAYDDMNEEHRRRLASIASDLQRVTVALGERLDLHEDEDAWRALTTACSRLEVPQRTVDVTEHVLRLERIPSISQLLLFGVLSHRDIPDIRRRQETEAFRRWLWSQPNPADAESVADAYLAKIAPKARRTDSRWFKAARIAAVGVAGSAAGQLAAGPVGGIVGGAISTAAGIATSFVDSFWIEALLATPNPRRFATDVIQPIINERVYPRTALRSAEYRQSEVAPPERRASFLVALPETEPSCDSGNTPFGAAPQPSRTREQTQPCAKRTERNRRKARRRAARKARRRNR